MKHLTPLLAAAAVAASLVAACGAADRHLTLALVGKSNSGEYWLAVRHGAEREAAREGVKLLFLGPASEEDAAGQIAMLQSDAIDRHVDGIAVSPIDAVKLGPVVKAAVAAGIKVVTLDSDTAARDRLSYIGTDNEAAGAAAGQAMLALLPPHATVATLSGPAGAQNLAARVRGFQRAVGQQLTLLPPESDGGQKDRALELAARVLATHPGVLGFFSTTAIAGPAIAQAVAAAHRGSDARVVSFDSTRTLLGLLHQDQVQALVAQQPERMGALAVEWLVKALDGQTPPALVTTGVDVVTRGSLATFDR